MELSKVTRDKVMALEGAIKSLPPAEVVTTHHFDHGVYQRGMFVRAGTAVTGKIHLHENLLVLAKGRALLLSGPEPVEVGAPWACVSEGGVKRVALALTDCYFISYVETDSIEVAAIESATVVDTYEQYDQLKGAQHVIHGIGSSGRGGLSCGEYPRGGTDSLSPGGRIGGPDSGGPEDPGR